jgi:prepilin-type N-terminal cleavage/methylation domain-containing protein
MCGYSTRVKGNSVAFKKGFGLVELLVSISIILVIMGVVLIKNSAFSSAVTLRNEAYNVAFGLREAQTLAVSSNQTAAGAVQRFGVHAQVASTSIIIFRDVNNDSFFSPGSGDVIVESIRLGQGFHVRDIVNGTGGNITGTELSVTFTRPDFDAVFRRQSTGGTVTGPINIEVSPVGATGNSIDAVRWVEVTSTGQVVVKTAS